MSFKDTLCTGCKITIVVIVLILFFVFGMTGSDCIEAGDFGEDDTVNLSVPSNVKRCMWWEDATTDGSGDTTIATCLTDDNGTNYFSPKSKNSCKITLLSGPTNDRNFKKVKATLKMNGISSKYWSDNYSFAGCGSDKDEWMGYLREIYTQAVDSCKNKCESLLYAGSGLQTVQSTYSDPFEPNWIPINGIDIENGRHFKLTISGNIALTGEKESKLKWDAGKYGLQKQVSINGNSAYFPLNSSAPFTMSGSWEKDTGTGSVRKFGEKSGWNTTDATQRLQMRTNFFRRGVVYLQEMPSVNVQGNTVRGQVSSSGDYTGPDLDYDVKYASCKYNSSFALNYVTDCSYIDTDNTKTDLIRSANNIMYALNNDLAKTYIGSVIPMQKNEKILEYVTKNPFKDFDCDTEKDYNGIISRACTVGSESFANQDLLYNGSKRGYVFNNSDGSAYTLDVRSVIFPVKIMVRVWGAIDNGSTCEVLVKMPQEMQSDDLAINLVDEFGVPKEDGRWYSIKIPANDKWYYITDKTLNKKPIIFGKNPFHSLKDTHDGKINTTGNSYDIQFKSLSPSSDWDKISQAENTFLAPKNLKYVPPISSDVVAPCGAGMVAMLLPQDEVVIRTSGYVKFRNLLINNTTTCTADSTGEKCADATISKPININYIVTNPKVASYFSPYSGHHVPPYLIKKENFYELKTTTCYKDDGTLPDSCPTTLPVGSNSKSTYSINSVSLSKDKWSSSSIYVRKGQSIRFDETTWYDIVGNDTDGYEVNEKIFIAGVDNNDTPDIPSDDKPIKKSVGDGLLLMIEEKPALLCTGSKQEDLSNNECQEVRYDDGTTSCRVSFTEFCNSLSGNEKDRYCPLGCYRKKIGESAPLESSKETGYGAKIGHYQSFYVDEYDRQQDSCPYPFDNMPDGFNDPMSIEKCQSCRNYITGDKVQSPTISASVDQCYDLENYVGSVTNLISSNYRISADEASGYDYDKDVFEKLGLKKIESIFTSNGKNYGTLEGMYIDSSKKNSDGTYSEYIYKTPGSLNVEKPVIMKFLVLNSDTNLNNTTDTANVGDYSIDFNNEEVYRNGENLGILIAHKDWSGGNDSDVMENACFYSDGVRKSCVKKWVLRYDVAKVKSGNHNMNYGTLRDGQKYTLNTENGKVKDTIFMEDGFIFSDLKEGVDSDDPVEDKYYSELRMFVKVIDKMQRGTTAANGGCPVFKVPQYEETYRCESNAAYVALDTISCQDSSLTTTDKTVSGACPTSSSNSVCKKNGSSYVFPTDSQRSMKRCTDLYYNNNGEYHIRVKAPRNFKKMGTAKSGSDVIETNYAAGLVTKIQGFAIDRIMIPMQELMEGKSMGLYNPTGSKSLTFSACTSTTISKACAHFDPLNNNFDSLFGNQCKIGDANCYKTCAVMDADEDGYAEKCYRVSDNGGFVKMFYNIIIQDSKYHLIVKIFFTLMITFLGLGHLLGLTEIKHDEMLKLLVKMGIIYLFIGEFGWYWYNRFFVQFFRDGTDYLVFAVASAFEPESSLTNAMRMGDFYDKKVLFSTTDRNLSLIFSMQVTYKIFGLLSASFLGWLYVLMIYSALINYIAAVASALVAYMTSIFFTNLVLSFGPIFFVLLIFKRTKSMFDKWLNALIGYTIEQITLISCLSMFNGLVYNIIKMALSYRVCWRPIWIVELPILGSLKLWHFWRIANGRLHEVSATSGIMPGLFTVMMIYCITEVMKAFLKWAGDLGNDFSGSGLKLSDFSKVMMSNSSGDIFEGAAKSIKDGAEKTLTGARDSLADAMGFKNQETLDKEAKEDKDLIKGLRTAEREGDKERNKLAAEGVKDEKTGEMRPASKKELDDAYKKGHSESLKKSGVSAETLARHGANEGNAHKLSAGKVARDSSDSLIGLAANAGWHRAVDGDSGENKADSSSVAAQKSIKEGVEKIKAKELTQLDKDLRGEGGAGISIGEFGETMSAVREVLSGNMSAAEAAEKLFEEKKADPSAEEFSAECKDEKGEKFMKEDMTYQKAVKQEHYNLQQEMLKKKAESEGLDFDQLKKAESKRDPMILHGQVDPRSRIMKLHDFDKGDTERLIYSKFTDEEKLAFFNLGEEAKNNVKSRFKDKHIKNKQA